MDTPKAGRCNKPYLKFHCQNRIGPLVGDRSSYMQIFVARGISNRVVVNYAPRKVGVECKDI